MKRIRISPPLGLLAILAFIAPSRLEAQVNLGADFYSRYIWRGADFGNSFSVQPALGYTAKNVEIGAWSSYSISAEGASATELDLYVSLSAGPLSVGVTDYHFPNVSELFDFGSEGEGAHFIEPFASFSGPIDLYAGVFAYNDPAHSVYLQASKAVSVQETEVTFTLAGTLSGSDDTPSLYGTTGSGLLVMGISASKELAITDRFSLPVSVSYVINPYAERSFLFFGFSLK